MALEQLCPTQRAYEPKIMLLLYPGPHTELTYWWGPHIDGPALILANYI